MIQSEPRGSVAILRFDRADKRNALTPKMLGSLASHIDTAGSAHAIVLSGVGEAFCAGFDLSLCRDDPGVLGQLLAGLSRVVRLLRQSPAPIVISAHGAAIAGGCALLGGGDIVVTTQAAKIGYPVVRLGISPAVSAPTLRCAVGDGHARARMLDSGLIDGRRALAIGLAHECVDTAAACEARAIAIAEELAAKPRHALAYTKRWLNEIDGTGRDDAYAAALEVSQSLVGGEEERERLEQLWKNQAR